MAVNFPDNPQSGDTFDTPNMRFTYDGNKWVTFDGSVVDGYRVIEGAEGPQGATGPSGATGPTGPTGATGTFASGADANIGTLTVAQVDIASDLNITDGTTTKYTFARTSGDFTATGNVTAYSDISLKENVEEISDALEKVSSIRGVTYNRKDLDGARHAGVIAQEVEAVLPEVVVTNEEGIKTVAYGNLVGLLVEAIKELKEEVETLKGGN